MAMSANGQYITAALPSDGGGYYTGTTVAVSIDSGATFTYPTITGSSGAPPSVSVSQSGRYQIIAEYDEGKNDSGILISTNYGTSWSEKFIAGVGAGDFSACAVSETSPSGNPVFIAAGTFPPIGDGPLRSGFVYSRNSGNTWTTITSYTGSGGSTLYGIIASIQISNDGTRLLVIDSAVAVCYQLTSGALTQVSYIGVATIDGHDISSLVASNLTSTGFTIMAQLKSTGNPIFIFQFSWPTATSTPAFISGSGIRIDSNISGNVNPRQIVSSSDGTYQLAVCNDLLDGTTNTYLSSNSGASWTLIPQSASSPFNSITFIIMSADARKIYCICGESGSFTQLLRSCIAAPSFIKSSAIPYAPALAGTWSNATQPTTLTDAIDTVSYNTLNAFTYRATGPTGPTGGPTGPYGQPTTQVSTHLVPKNDMTYDLGATGLRFRDLYMGGSTIYLGDSVTLSGSAGTLSVNSAPLVSSSTALNTGAGGVGVTFTPRTLPSPMSGSNIGNIAMSANGQYLTYIASTSSFPEYIRVSSDYGANFTTRGGSMRSYNYVTVSSTGQYQAALVNSNGVYFSSDYGVTWVNVGLSSVSSWGGIRISTDGQIVIAWLTSNQYYITKNIIPTNSNDWSSEGFTYFTVDVQMSSNGDRVLQFGTDFMSRYIQGFKVNRSEGLANLSTSPSNSIQLSGFSSSNISLSGDGTRIGIYGSSNISTIISQQFSWSISGSGSITQVGSNNTIVSGGWYSAFPTAMSSNGAVQLIAGGQNDSQGAYISYNYGVTWSQIAQSSNPNIIGTSWYYILVTSDATYINVFPSPGSTAWGQCLATSPTIMLTNIPYTPAAPLTWPSAAQPTTIGGALDLIARFFNTNYQFSSSWQSFS